MLIGYARVSTRDQSTDIQVAALKEYGCDEEYIFKENVSGKEAASRSQLQLMLKVARSGDTIVVHKLDRLGRSLSDLVGIVDSLRARGVGFVSLDGKASTETSQGRMVFGLFATLAEYEREQILERTAAGREAARARGKLGGRKAALDAEQSALLFDLYEGKKHTLKALAELFGVSVRTVTNYVKREQGRRDAAVVAEKAPVFLSGREEL